MKSINLVMAASILASVPAFAKQNVNYDYAKVTNVAPITEIIRVETPRRECWDEQVAVRDRHRNNSATPVLIGSILGGVLGNEIGRSKDAKRAGTVAGVLLGGSIGRDIGKRAGGGEHIRYTTEEVCKTYQDVHEEERVTGYDVEYRYRGQRYTTQTAEHPGDRIKVRVSVSPVNYYSANTRYRY